MLTDIDAASAWMRVHWEAIEDALLLYAILFRGQPVSTSASPNVPRRFVAQAETNVTINYLFDHFPSMRLDPDQPAPYIAGGLEQRGVSDLPVILQ